MPINRKELFEEIQNTYGHVLRRLCSCHSPSREITEELYQEALTNIYQAIPTYRGQASINTWAYRITLNTCLKSYEGTKGIKLVGLDDIESIAPCEQSLEEKTDLRIMLDFASNFTLIDRELIYLYLLGEDQKTIAETLGLSLANVSTKIGRLKEKIIIYMEKETTHD